MSGRTFQNPERAPEYNLHREVAAADVAADTVKAHGMVMQDYRYANIQVVPAGGANPDIEVMFWSEEAGAFISEHTALAFSGIGVNTPYEVTVDANGRRLWVMVPTMAAGSCKIFVGGFKTSQR
jgi:hypothetical protein